MRSTEAQFEQVWQEFSPAVLRYARRRVSPEDVDDVVAETFVVVWRRLADAPDFPLPWLLGVARHVCANMRRSGRRYEALHARLTELPPPESRRASESSDDPQVTAAAGALRRLGERDRELLTLIAWDGLSSAEAAVALGCSQAALRVRLHRARRRFAALLAEVAGEGREPGTGDPPGEQRDTGPATPSLLPVTADPMLGGI
ncbi:MAG: polymerase, sigma-24 subunit, subfamily [Streptosporangiaceae bacterium]|nr:polymerase, sigma-24 subunit, subfamily [Streptosporangiaceae bacterium]